MQEALCVAPKTIPGVPQNSHLLISATEGPHARMPCGTAECSSTYVGKTCQRLLKRVSQLPTYGQLASVCLTYTAVTSQLGISPAHNTTIYSKPTTLHFHMVETPHHYFTSGQFLMVHSSSTCTILEFTVRKCFCNFLVFLFLNPGFVFVFWRIDSVCCYISLCFVFVEFGLSFELCPVQLFSSKK